jgi:hypothetical protein
MRSLAVGAALALLVAAPAFAQPASRDLPAPPASPIGPPRVFANSGSTQPDITPGLCQNLNPTATRCTIPAMTAGRYVIETTGTSSAPRANARQALQILIIDGATGRLCGTAQTNNPWTTGARTIRLNCAVTLVTDRTLIVQVNYGDENATKDPRGPTLTVRRLPWDGVLEQGAFSPPQGQ